jgi:hypothetical protein
MSATKTLDEHLRDAPLVDVEIAHLVQHKAFQPREQLDLMEAKRYATRMLAGEVPPPITVARLTGSSGKVAPKAKQWEAEALPDGTLVVIDGFHRVHAAEEAGQWTLPARVIECTARNAVWLAVQANMNHGVTLKRRDIPRIIDAYIRDRQYLTGDTKRPYRSYREMAHDLQQRISHETLRKHIQRRYPWLYRKLAEKGAEQHGPLQPAPATDPMDTLVQDFAKSAGQLALAAAAMSPHQRGEALAHLKSALVTLEGLPSTAPEF